MKREDIKVGGRYLMVLSKMNVVVRVLKLGKRPKAPSAKKGTAVKVRNESTGLEFICYGLKRFKRRLDQQRSSVPDERVADALRKVALAVETELESGRRAGQIDAYDVAELFLAIADEIDPPLKEKRKKA